MKTTRHFTAYETNRNALKHCNYSPLAIFHESQAELAKKIFNDMRVHLFDKNEGETILTRFKEICLEEINTSKSIRVIEETLEKRLFTELFNNSLVVEKVKERAHRISEQLQAAVELEKIELLPEHAYMDFGCGSGIVAQSITDRYGFRQVLIADVVDYVAPEVKADDRIQFKFLEKSYKSIGTDNNFHLITMTNVLHHSKDPFKTFDMASRYLGIGGYMLVIESCINITEEYTHLFDQQPRIPYQAIWDEHNNLLPEYLEYIRLSEEAKMIYGVFFDWLYNRAFVNNDICTPYNFGTPTQWNKLFDQSGYDVINTYLMGMDQPSVLEYHTLHILKRR